MSRPVLIFLFQAFFFLNLSPVYPQVPTISAETDKQKVLIGELVTLKIRVKSATASSLNWNLADSALTDFTVLKSTILQQKPGITERHIIFTSADSGTFQTGKLPVDLNSNGRKISLMAPALTVRFLPEKPITALHDLKPQQEMPITFYRHPLFWAPAGFFLLAAAGLIFWQRKIKTRQALSENRRAKTAWQELQRLENKIKTGGLPNAEVSRELAFILKAAQEKVTGRKPDPKTVGEITRKLAQLQFGPEAAEKYQENKLLAEVQQILIDQEIREELS